LTSILLEFNTGVTYNIEKQHLFKIKDYLEPSSGYLSAAKCKWFGYGPADATSAHCLLFH